MSLEATRGSLRLGSALILLAFVACHLTAHAFLLISFDAADAALNALMAPWRTGIGMAVLAAAAAIHYANALWSVYRRRSLRLVALGMVAARARPLHSGAADAPRDRGARRRQRCGFRRQLPVDPGAAMGGDAVACGTAGSRRPRRVDPRDDRPAFLAAHQALVSGLAGRAVHSRPVAAGICAQRLRCGWQSDFARRRKRIRRK